MSFRFLVVSIAFPCFGCASIFSGTSQNISVNTNPAGASCVFERQGENIGAISKTPGTLTVRKSKYDITIKCDKPGYRTASVLDESGTSATIAASLAVDILTFGVPTIIDSADGADNKYNENVSLALIPVASAQR